MTTPGLRACARCFAAPYPANLLAVAEALAKSGDSKGDSSHRSYVYLLKFNGLYVERIAVAMPPSLALVIAENYCTDRVAVVVNAGYFFRRRIGARERWQ